MSNQVVIVKTGVANVASVASAFAACGTETVITDLPDQIAQAPLVVLPGVGTFGAGMEALARAGLVAVLRERINRSRPLLAICLGMQLLYEWSEESPGVVGLGVIAGGIRRFAGPSRVPHMGWNLIRPELSCGMLHEGWVYFANSFRAQEPPAGWKHAFARYDGDFVAGIERGPVLACQFHPELSGSMGRAIIRRWMHASAVPAARETGSC